MLSYGLFAKNVVTNFILNEQVSKKLEIYINLSERQVYIYFARKNLGYEDYNIKLLSKNIKEIFLQQE